MSEHKRLFRSQNGRMLGGVCAGLARYFAIDPMLMRLAFIGLAFVNGLGVMIYLLMWIIVPDEAGRELSGEDAVRANANDIAQQARRLGESLRTQRGAMLGGLLLIGLGALFLLNEFVPGLRMGMLWPLLLVILGVYLLITRR